MTEKCRVQILEEHLCGMNPWIINDNDFLLVKSAYDTCLNLLWIEEKFIIVRENFYEWEQEIKNSYDFLIANQSDKPDCNKIMSEHGVNEIVVLNRRLSNVLGSIRMYRDQVLHDLSTLEKNLKVDNLKKCFEKETNIQYDSSFSYQMMELMRNYMQHQGLIIERITAMIPFNRKICEELWYFVEANYFSIKKIENFTQKIKSKGDFNEGIEWINIIGILREYFCQIIKIHMKFRDITASIFIKAFEDIDKVVKAIYRDLPVKVVAFHGKEGSEDYKDFLLQMVYVDKLVSYREESIELSNSKAYLSKKPFVCSDEIKVSNSVRCSFRYNS